jgi:hypothetical protein
MPRIKVTALSLCLLSSLASQFVLPAYSAEGKPAAASTVSSATELANQVAAAYGGMVKIKEMLNRGSRCHGFLKNVSTISSSSNVFECEVISKGDKVRIEMEFLGQPKIEAFDGKTGWTQSGNLRRVETRA